MDLSKIPLPEFYPDAEEIRSDIADYYFEVQRFNRQCGKAIKLLEETGQLDNTIVVITGDNGMPFPRCKSNIYDMGVRVPMAIQWPAIKVPPEMSGRSLLPTLLSKKDGLVDKKRDHVVFGKERHTPAQKAPSLDGYPCRGIRTEQYLYIRNFKPERWPAGVASGATHPKGIYTDCDNGPTKQYLLDNRDDPEIKRYYDLSFARRPAEELYDISKDPDQIHNVVADAKYAQVKNKLSEMLMAKLKRTADPRVVGGGEQFDKYPYRAPYKLNKK
jgi:arylsulfatase A-like enzyme